MGRAFLRDLRRCGAERVLSHCLSLCLHRLLGGNLCTRLCTECLGATRRLSYTRNLREASYELGVENAWGRFCSHRSEETEGQFSTDPHGGSRRGSLEDRRAMSL